MNAAHHHAGATDSAHGTERYLIPGGGSRALALFEGDAISLLDFDGFCSLAR